MDIKTARELDSVLAEFRRAGSLDIRFMKLRQATKTEPGLEFPLGNYLQELERLGFIMRFEKTNTYLITFQGRVFRGFENEILSEEDRIKEQHSRELRNVILSGIGGAVLTLAVTLPQTCQKEESKYLLLDSLKIQAVHDTVHINIDALKSDTSLVRLVNCKKK